MAKLSHASMSSIKLLFSLFLFRQFWHANIVVSMKVPLLTGGL